MKQIERTSKHWFHVMVHTYKDIECTLKLSLLNEMFDEVEVSYAISDWNAVIELSLIHI